MGWEERRMSLQEIWAFVWTYQIPWRAIFVIAAASAVGFGSFCILVAIPMRGPKRLYRWFSRSEWVSVPYIIASGLVGLTLMLMTFEAMKR
jgi:hypothetical protein